MSPLTKITCYVDQTVNNIRTTEAVMTYAVGAVAKLQAIGLKALGSPTTGTMRFDVDPRYVEATIARVEAALDSQVQLVGSEADVLRNVVKYVPLNQRNT